MKIILLTAVICLFGLTAKAEHDRINCGQLREGAKYKLDDGESVPDFVLVVKKFCSSDSPSYSALLVDEERKQEIRSLMASHKRNQEFCVDARWGGYTPCSYRSTPKNIDSASDSVGDILTREKMAELHPENDELKY